MRPFAISIGAAMLTSSASALDLCRVLHCIEASDAPAVSITLDVKAEKRVFMPTVRIDLGLSDQVCDPSLVTSIGLPLPIDKDGRGSGELRAFPDHTIKATWEFSCATPKNASTEHKLRFTIDSIDSIKVSEVSFETRFRQTWPVVFTSVESSSLARNPEFSRGTIHYGPEPARRDKYDGEL
ncbi:hypothetical protein FZEAL_10180 [Fusarium zealandicum]|uniref:Uncharacterized protein n=1 Tax=Fusarium zealandicum TaxID=1053134 RepID=A0A8H4XCW0_9HYPO|nr:hypothetical protein FZEAL_10180 [Fusarium zealandicum]